MAHHFRHDGQTCHESMIQVPEIQGWHHFHLDYPLELVELLRENYRPDSKYPQVYRGKRTISLAEHGLVKYNHYALNHEYSETGKIVVGALPLAAFSAWMRNQLQSRVETLQHEVSDGLKHRAWYEIEFNRQQGLLNASLYLFEFNTSCGQQIFKIGRTSRDVLERLAETQGDVEQALSQSVSAQVVRVVPMAGFVEKYALHRYASHRFDLASHTEYLQLTPAVLRKLKSDLTKLAKQSPPFNKAENFIASGRWRYEDKRKAASKEGIARRLRSGATFGRPRGTVLTQSEFHQKHQDVVDLLLNGNFSISEIVKVTVKSRSTVKRIKSSLKN